MSHRQYLEELNYSSIEKQTKNDSRRQKKRWKKERKKYGFDQRDTWNMDTTMIELLYERIRMYLEVTIVDLDYHKILINGTEKTLRYWLRVLLVLCAEFLTEDEDYSKIDDGTLSRKIWSIWAELVAYVWW